MDIRILFVFCVITMAIKCESIEEITCETSPFLEQCIQRKVFNQTYTHVVIPKCRNGSNVYNFVLLAVKTKNLTSVLTNEMQNDLETNRTTPAGEQSQACLFEQLRPYFTGYTGVSQRLVNYSGCHVDVTTFGYIVWEYACIKDPSESIATLQCNGTFTGIKIPIRSEDPSESIATLQCNGTFTGIKIPIRSEGFPYEGIPNISSDCKCSIETEAPFINITIYFMELSAEQSISILDQHNKGFNATNTSMLEPRETGLPVHGPLFLAWSNHLATRNSKFKYWMEIQANGTNITINCDQQMSTISPTTELIPEISTYNAGSKTRKQLTEQLTKEPHSTVTRTITLVSPARQKTSSVSDSSTVVTIHTSSVDSTDSLPITKVHLTNSSIGTSTLRTAASTADSDGSKFPIIPVVIGIVVFLILLLITCILVIVCCKRHKDKKKKQTDTTETDNKDPDQDETKGTADDKDENKVVPIIGDKLSTPLLPQFTAPLMASQISNSAFDKRRLPLLIIPQQSRDTRDGTQTHVVNEIDNDDDGAIKTRSNLDETQINGVNAENGDGGTKKKKKKKKKRKHRNKVHPAMDEYTGDDDLDAGESKHVEDQDTSLTV